MARIVREDEVDGAYPCRVCGRACGNLGGRGRHEKTHEPVKRDTVHERQNPYSRRPPKEGRRLAGRMLRGVNG